MASKAVVPKNDPFDTEVGPPLFGGFGGQIVIQSDQAEIGPILRPENGTFSGTAESLLPWFTASDSILLTHMVCFGDDVGLSPGIRYPLAVETAAVLTPTRDESLLDCRAVPKIYLR